jgi:hypothetical protein
LYNEKVQSNNFHFYWHYGLRHVNKYYIFKQYLSNEVIKNNYTGIYAGPSFALGNKHGVNFDILFGLGMVKPKGSGGFDFNLESTFKLGYNFIHEQKININFGAYLNIARNSYENPYFGGYLGVGLNF